MCNKEYLGYILWCCHHSEPVCAIVLGGLRLWITNTDKMIKINTWIDIRWREQPNLAEIIWCEIGVLVLFWGSTVSGELAGSFILFFLIFLKLFISVQCSCVDEFCVSCKLRPCWISLLLCLLFTTYLTSHLNCCDYDSVTLTLASSGVVGFY